MRDEFLGEDAYRPVHFFWDRTDDISERTVPVRILDQFESVKFVLSYRNQFAGAGTPPVRVTDTQERTFSSPVPTTR